ncbi:hypothetical protein MHBO_004719 [Bonamia ostreae]|uniref:L-asparaginase N-terminal domain-containing protein n=1 Tax=Bonamia ostreae TaxID=126728 RepID=A0ABV2AU48_9EUKA
MKDFAIMENKEMPKVDVVEWEESIDSSYITPQHWVKLVKQIEENYLKYDGFVILHGYLLQI